MRIPGATVEPALRLGRVPRLLRTLGAFRVMRLRLCKCGERSPQRKKSLRLIGRGMRWCIPILVLFGIAVAFTYLFLLMFLIRSTAGMRRHPIVLLRYYTGEWSAFWAVVLSQGVAVLLGIGAGVIAYRILFRIRLRRYMAEPFCIKCEYPLTDLDFKQEGFACPECGCRDNNQVDFSGGCHG